MDPNSLYAVQEYSPLSAREILLICIKENNIVSHLHILTQLYIQYSLTCVSRTIVRYRKRDKSIVVAGYLEALSGLKRVGVLERPFDVWAGSATNPTREDRGISGLDSDGGQWLEN